ncbi:LAME_0E05270g1_1 [Lachancea meyersii CBS 8951]|uniref:LAME_0E05270g1_1 n=1 Tax=Lachancea meyersii CBS 8951 TaxID=1266667 RepID=A0A1G4JH73_9SACH|nr:LAME_0E05270g1_1 [Lachancea meyersii CBS 8951]
MATLKTSCSSHKAIILPYLIKYIPKNFQSKSISDEFKVYAFDLDHTIIKPKFGGRFSRSENDWTFMSFPTGTEGKTVQTIDILSEILTNYTKAHIVIFSNQGATVTVPPTSKSCTKFTKKIGLVLQAISGLDLALEDRIWIYASPKKPASLSSTKKAKRFTQRKVVKISSKDNAQESMASDLLFNSMRKPNSGMFEEFSKDFGGKFKLEYYCGDAAGRSRDFSNSDKQFAVSIGAQFLTPEQVFVQN